MKLHSVVLANCSYVPSVMLEYRPKCSDYMSSVGQEKYNIRTDQFRAKDVWSLVEDMNANRERYSRELYSAIKPLRDRQKLKAEDLMNSSKKHYYEKYKASS